MSGVLHLVVNQLPFLGQPDSIAATFSRVWITLNQTQARLPVVGLFTKGTHASGDRSVAQVKILFEILIQAVAGLSDHQKHLQVMEGLTVGIEAAEDGELPLERDHWRPALRQTSSYPQRLNKTPSKSFL